jgi:hypothetical protein
VNTEVTLDAEFCFPVLFPLVSGVLLEHDHLREFRRGCIFRTPSNSFQPAAELTENPLKQRYRFRGNDAGLAPELNVREEPSRYGLQIAGGLPVSLSSTGFDRCSISFLLVSYLLWISCS